MFYKIRDYIRKHFIGYRPSDMPCIDYLESKGVEKMKDEEIEIYVNGEKVDITDIYEPLKQGEYFYKENGKWYAHRLKNVTFEVEENKKLHSIIKEVREYIGIDEELRKVCTNYDVNGIGILEILGGENNDK